MQNNIDKEWAKYCGLSLITQDGEDLEWIGLKEEFEKFNDEELKAKWLEQNETF